MANMKITVWKLAPRMQRSIGGTWVHGKVGPYKYQALVFPEHADNEDWELGRSQISKLWVAKGNFPVFSWDRGLDKAAEMVVEHQAVNLLKDNLARMVFGAAVAKAGGKKRGGGGSWLSQYVTHGEWGVRWTEFDRNGRLVTKEKILDTEDKRAAFVRKLQKKDNYNGVVAYCTPQGPLGVGGLSSDGSKWSDGGKRRKAASKRTGKSMARAGKKPVGLGAVVADINRLTK